MPSFGGEMQIMKKINPVIFWILSLTWGGILTLIGLTVALVLVISGHKPKKFGCCIYFEIGENWGGLELGAIFLTNKNPTFHIKQHEAGHGIQNIMFGVFMPFLVSIPSAVRYWHRIFLVETGRKKESELSDYDSVWFEKQATKLGEKYFSNV